MWTPQRDVFSVLSIVAGSEGTNRLLPVDLLARAPADGLNDKGSRGNAHAGRGGCKLNCVNGHRKNDTKETRWPSTSTSSTNCWRTTRSPKTSLAKMVC